MKPERVAVVGLGVVGIPLALRLADKGFTVVGFDVNAERVEALAAGRYPLDGDEPGIPELLSRVHGSGRFTPSTDPVHLARCAVYVLCVDTPYDDAKAAPDHRNLASAARTVGSHLSKGALVVVESTVAPGTTLGIVRESLEASSGLSAGKDFGLGHCPERVMPGKLLKNLVSYERVVGGIDAATTKRMVEFYGTFIEGKLSPTDVATAEVVKTVENTYRDVQIAFANELAMACEVIGVDFFLVRELVNRVEARNVHLAGVGVGGHCIPKDPMLFAFPLRGRMSPVIVDTARKVNLSMPLHAAEIVRRELAAAGLKVLRGAKVAVLGASYLPGTGDTRAAPSLPLAERLKEWGAQVVVVDPHAKRLGAFEVTADLARALEGAAAAVLATAHKEFLAADWKALATRMKVPLVVDGRGALDPEAMRRLGFRYAGIGRGAKG